MDDNSNAFDLRHVTLPCTRLQSTPLDASKMEHRLEQTALLLSALIALQICASAAETYPYRLWMDNRRDMQLKWKLNDTNIIFELTAKTTGWIGIGFSPGTDMVGADIIVGWVKDGQPTITDRHGTSKNGFPPLDALQNVELLSADETGQWTTLKFQRLLDTCDVNDYVLTGNTIRLIWAYGDSDPTGQDITRGNYHKSKRGFERIQLFGTKLVPPPSAGPNETLSTFELSNNSTHIPVNTTYHNCRLLQLPDFGSKVHVVTIVSKMHLFAQRSIVRMMLYQCASEVQTSDAVNTSADCFSYDIPGDFFSCNSLMFVWTIGMDGPFNFPQDVGLSLGGANDPKYVLLETHYENPTNSPDTPDQSGLGFVYTRQARMQDAGLLEVGMTRQSLEFVIPPGTPSYKMYGQCSPNCLRESLVEENQSSLNVFGVILHSRMLAKSLSLRHVRNGTELSPIAEDSTYDTFKQATRFLQPEKVIQSGDALEMICDYNSLDRTKITLGGSSMRDETCVSFIYYYPKIRLTECTTTLDIVALGNVLNFSKFHANVTNPQNLYDFVIDEPSSLATKSIGQAFDERNWTQSTRQQLEHVMKTFQRSQTCEGDEYYIPANLEQQVPPLRILHPYVAAQRNCSQQTQVYEVFPSPATTTMSTAKTTTGKPLQTTSHSARNLPNFVAFLMSIALFLHNI